MNTETMSVLKALKTCKIIQDRLDGLDNSIALVAANRTSAKKIDGVLKAEFCDKAKANFQSAVDTINRYGALKSAISEYNAKTVVTIGGKQYTIAAALDFKNSGLQMKRLLLEKLKSQYVKAKNKIVFENGDKLDRAIAEAAAKFFEGATKPNSPEYMQFAADYRDNNEFTLVDPIGIEDAIRKLESEIADFEAEVDTAITASNAVTEITITY